MCHADHRDSDRLREAGLLVSLCRSHVCYRKEIPLWCLKKKKGYHLTPASVSPLAGHTWHMCLYILAQSSQPESSHGENKRKPEWGSSVFYKTERTTSSNTNLALKKHWHLFYIDKTKEVAGHRARHASAHLQSQHLGTEAEDCPKFQVVQGYMETMSQTNKKNKLPTTKWIVETQNSTCILKTKFHDRHSGWSLNVGCVQCYFWKDCLFLGLDKVIIVSWEYPDS